MGIIELFLIAVGLSMDAFAVAVCIGLSMQKAGLTHSLVVGLYFGAFQGLMPLAGYLIGARFSVYAERFDHWIAFILLSMIGGKMIGESFAKDKKCPDRECPPDLCTDRTCPAPPREMSLAPKAMLPLALATSIDALAIGVSFAFLQVNIIPAVLCIGVTTLILSMTGVKIGKAFGAKLKEKAELFGGAVLILIGLKILLEHLGILTLG